MGSSEGIWNTHRRIFGSHKALDQLKHTKEVLCKPQICACVGTNKDKSLSLPQADVGQSALFHFAMSGLPLKSGEKGF